MEDLHTKYRPTKFEDVIGQKVIVRSLKDVMDAGSSHSFLFTGPSGVGKTTLARIVANLVGCDAMNIIEIDAATYTGIDAMRGITESTNYHAFGASPNRAIIIDEVHGLSKQAFQALLKSLEEPPPHIYWLLCTTEPSKVPATIKTRCLSYDLKPVSANEIFDLLEEVCDKEDLDPEEGILNLISKEAGGSPRQALVYLSMCSGCSSRAEAAELLRTAAESKDVIDLCRFLISGKGFTWDKAMKMLEPLKDHNAESIRLVVVSYVTTVLLKTKSTKTAEWPLRVLDCFSRPCYPGDKLAPILLAIGDVFNVEREEDG